jgi:hypothetical protein
MKTDSAQARIRTGTYDDIPDVLKLWREADTAPSTTDDPDGLNVLLSVAPSALLIAEHQGQIIGTLVATFDGCAKVVRDPGRLGQTLRKPADEKPDDQRRYGFSDATTHMAKNWEPPP